MLDKSLITYLRSCYFFNLVIYLENFSFLNFQIVYAMHVLASNK